jgi:hypothetical protein
MFRRRPPSFGLQTSSWQRLDQEIPCLMELQVLSSPLTCNFHDVASGRETVVVSSRRSVEPYIFRSAPRNELFTSNETPKSNEPQPPKLSKTASKLKEASGSFGAKLKAKAKKLVPRIFKKKIAYPPARPLDHSIDTGDADPGRTTGRPLSPPENDAVRVFTKEGFDNGFIEESSSPWSAPLPPVKKKNGTWRICVDFRALNRVTKKNAYPLPRIDESYCTLRDARYFTSLDLRSGYYQVRLLGSAKEKTAFTCRYGHFQFKELPFGLTNAPATFQNVMNATLAKYIDKSCMVYLDDIIVYSRTKREHEQHVLEILRALEDAGFVLSEEKCEWAQPELPYLGHIISGEGVRVNPEKVSAINDWKRPENITELRGFLNIAGYYRRFIKGFAKIASALYNLLKGLQRKVRKLIGQRIARILLYV